MRTPAPLLLAALLAAPAAAQEGAPRRPPADTIRLGAPAASDSIRMADPDDAEDADDSAEAPAPRRAAGPFAAASGRGPFTVESSGRVEPGWGRREVVWAGERPAPRVARRDTAAPAADTAAPPARTAAAPAQRPATAPATPPSGAGARARAHTVEAGETFFAIARRYAVTPAQLRAVNPGIDPEVLEVGDVLQLPAAARDTRAAGTPPPASAPAQPPRTPPAAAPAAPRGSRVHTVVAGETLFGLARRYGVTMADIRRANALETDQLRAGQRLVIPPAS